MLKEQLQNNNKSQNPLEDFECRNPTDYSTELYHLLSPNPTRKCLEYPNSVIGLHLRSQSRG